MTDTVNLLLLVFFIPFLWSGLIWGLDAFLGRGSDVLPDDAVAKVMLFLMLTPVLTGMSVLLADMIIYSSGELSSVLPVFMHSEFGSLNVVMAAEQLLDSRAGISVIACLAMFYLLGVGILSLRLIYQHLKLEKNVREGRYLKTVSGFDIMITQKELSPFAYFGRRIILPQLLVDRLSTDQIRMIIKHEVCHLLRRDSAYFFMLAVIDVIFWINPFVRLQTARCRLAAELCCDANVISDRESSRHTYANAILLTIENLKPRDRLIQIPPFNRNHKDEFRMRIKQIVSPESKSESLSFRKLFGVTILSLALVTGIQAAVADTSESKPPEFTDLPISGKITSSFGVRTSPFNGEKVKHFGTDIKIALGTPVMAPASGHVINTQSLEGYGLLLTLDHGGGYVTRYANLSEFKVSSGDAVRAGQVIALSGNSGRSTGPHLHIEVIVNGEHVDPQTVLSFAK